MLAPLLALARLLAETDLRAAESTEGTAPAQREPTLGIQGETPPSTEAIFELRDKLRLIVLPRVSFDNVTAAEAVAFLQAQAKMLDPEKKGVNLILRIEPATRNVTDATGAVAEVPLAPDDYRVTMDVRTRPLGEAIRCLSMSAGLWYRVKGEGVVIGNKPYPDGDDNMRTRTFSVDYRLLGYTLTQGNTRPDPPQAHAGAN